MEASETQADKYQQALLAPELETDGRRVVWLEWCRRCKRVHPMPTDRNVEELLS